MALMCDPEVLLLDEPAPALDVTVQAQVLQLLRTLRERTGVASIFVTRDFDPFCADGGVYVWSGFSVLLRLLDDA